MQRVPAGIGGSPEVLTMASGAGVPRRRHREHRARSGVTSSGLRLQGAQKFFCFCVQAGPLRFTRLKRGMQILRPEISCDFAAEVCQKNGPSSVSTHTCCLRAGLDEPSKPGELGEPCEPGEPSKLGEPGEPSKPGELRAHSQSSPNERF